MRYVKYHQRSENDSPSKSTSNGILSCVLELRTSKAFGHSVTSQSSVAVKFSFPSHAFKQDLVFLRRPGPIQIELPVSPRQASQSLHSVRTKNQMMFSINNNPEYSADTE